MRRDINLFFSKITSQIRKVYSQSILYVYCDSLSITGKILYFPVLFFAEKMESAALSLKIHFQFTQLLQEGNTIMVLLLYDKD